MRILMMSVLLILIGGVGILALENRAETTVRYFGQSATLPLPLLIGIVFLAGMFSGGFLLRFGRRLIRESA